MSGRTLLILLAMIQLLWWLHCEVRNLTASRAVTRNVNNLSTSRFAQDKAKTKSSGNIQHIFGHRRNLSIRYRGSDNRALTLIVAES